jgi:FkbM family methyltransferase
VTTEGRQVLLCRLPSVEPVLIEGYVGDVGVMAQVAVSEHYEPDVMKTLHALVAPDAVCVDGGANIGVLALALSRYAPSGQVVAFEPGASNLLLLQRNLERNQVSNVTVVPKGLWDRSGQLELNVDPQHPGGSYIGPNDGRTVVEAIEVTTLDAWVETEGLDRLDLIKLDVEGGEPFVLDGAVRTIERFHPTLVVELNPAALRQFHNLDSRYLYRRLRKLYRRLAYVREDGSRGAIIGLTHLDRLLQQRGLLNLVCYGENAQGLTAWLSLRARALPEVVRLLGQYNRLRPPTSAFLIDPAMTVETQLPDSVQVGERLELPVRLTNRGRTWWSSHFATHPIYAAYHWLDGDGSYLVRGGLITELPQAVGPGRSTSLNLTVEAPSRPGDHLLVITLVQDRYAWLDELAPDQSARYCVTVR